MKFFLFKASFFQGNWLRICFAKNYFDAHVLDKFSNLILFRRDSIQKDSFYLFAYIKQPPVNYSFLPCLKLGV